MRRITRWAGIGLGLGVMIGIGFAGGAAFANHQFNDVPNSSPFHDDVGWLTSHGIASGFPDSTFRPTDDVKRQQMARFLRNYNSSISLFDSSVDPPNAQAWEHMTSCPAGSRVIGGGGAIGAADVAMTRSSPEGANAWKVRYESDNNLMLNPSSLQVFVLCVPDDSFGS